ncbi:HAD-like domain-containing protein [Xylogone sp. PMI_703]|nr:HAD-like domain-containing protein [Xylogone sp. PMI_703]
MNTSRQGSMPSFPRIRACIFDMDGLLLNTEDLDIQIINSILSKYNRPPLPWSIRVQLQGRPRSATSKEFLSWAQLPISKTQYYQEKASLQQQVFPLAAPLPGVPNILQNLKDAGIHVALASSCRAVNFQLKTKHLGELFSVFDDRVIVGDDPRIPEGHGKPAPDIFQLALQTINETLDEGVEEIRPDECLVFEDSVSGVEAGVRAGMRVVWCPHPELLLKLKGKESEILAKMENQGKELRGELDCGMGRTSWVECLPSLQDFRYLKYGITSVVNS